MKENSQDFDELDRLIADIERDYLEIDEHSKKLDVFIDGFENWESVFNSLNNEVELLNSSFNEIFVSFDTAPGLDKSPVMLRLHYIGLVSAYEGFVRGFFNSMIAHKEICKNLILKISSREYKHSSSLMRLDKFKNCKNKEELIESFYKSSFSNANNLAETLAVLFGLHTSIPEGLHEIIDKRNVFVHNAGLDRDGKYLSINREDVEECGSLLQQAGSNYLNSVREKMNEFMNKSM